MREQLRGNGYQVFEIPFGHLTDREQMRRHFFAIGRILLGRDQARDIRENPQWFDAPSDEQANTDDGWDGSLELLDPEWRPLASGLRESGIPVPDDVDWDIVVEGRVSGARAVMMWNTPGRPVILIGEAESIPGGYNAISVDPNSDPAAVGSALRAALERVE